MLPIVKLPPRTVFISGSRTDGAGGVAGGADEGRGIAGWEIGATAVAGGGCDAVDLMAGDGGEVAFGITAAGGAGADACLSTLPRGCRSKYQSAPPAMTSKVRLSKKSRMFSRRFRVF